MVKTILRWLCAAVLCANAAAQAPVFPGEQWRRAPDLRAAGWSAEKLDQAEQFTRDKLDTEAWMLVHRGVVIREFGDVSRVSNVASVRKSVLSILIGMQVDANRFALERTLAELGIDDKEALSPTERAASLRHLLQGRSGIYHPSAYETPSMKSGRPARGAFKPGENFNYNNWDFNALGTAFAQLTGRTVYEALRDDLAGPLQLQDYRFDTAGSFHLESASIHPAYPMRLSVRDMARIGLLMARGGKWGDRPLVSSRWVDESTTAHSRLPGGNGYGYMWWVGFSQGPAARLKVPGRPFIASGNRGQFIVVDPARDIVFVHKVDFERKPFGDVTAAQFVELLERVLGAFEQP